MTDAIGVFTLLSRRTRVSVPVAEVAARLDIPHDDERGMDELEQAIAELESSGLVVLWDLPSRDGDGNPTTPVVTLSPLAASRLRLRLNSESTRWVPASRGEAPPRVRCQVLGDGSIVICNSDMPGGLPDFAESVAARQPDNDPSPDLRKVLAEERRLGLVRPTLAICGVRPFPIPGQSTAPIGPAHLGTAGEDPRQVGGYVGACDLCGGKELKPLTTLLPPRVTKTQIRPSQVVEGGELCAACCRHFQEERWPMVRRLKDDPRPKVAEKKPKTRKERRREGQATAGAGEKAAG
jgi:hypothetical protein